MLIDIIAFGLLLLALFKGLKKGLVLAVFSFVGIVIGLAAALKFSAVVAHYLSEGTRVSERWLPVLAFVLVFAATVLLVRLGAKAVEGALQVVLLGWVNRIGGILFYALLYFFVFSVLLFWANNLQLLKPTLKSASYSWPWIQPIAPRIIGVLGKMLPALRDLFAQLSAFFDSVPAKAS